MKIVLFDDQYKTAMSVAGFLCDALNDISFLDENVKKILFTSQSQPDEVPQDFQLIKSENTNFNVLWVQIQKESTDNLFLVINDEFGSILQQIQYLQNEHEFLHYFNICISDCQMQPIQGPAIVSKIGQSCCKILYSGDRDVQSLMGSNYSYHDTFNPADVHICGWDGYIIKSSDVTNIFYGEMAKFIKERYENKTQLLPQLIERLISGMNSPGRNLTHCNIVATSTEYVGHLFDRFDNFNNFKKECSDLSNRLPHYVNTLINEKITLFERLDLTQHNACNTIEKIKEIMGSSEDDLRYPNSLKTQLRKYVCKICEHISSDNFECMDNLTTNTWDYFVIEAKTFDCFLNAIMTGNDMGKCKLRFCVCNLGKFIIFQWERSGNLVQRITRNNGTESRRGGFDLPLIELSKWFTIFIKDNMGEVILRNEKQIKYCNLFKQIESNLDNGQLIVLHQDQ